jgi:hypothetical protein
MHKLISSDPYAQQIFKVVNGKVIKATLVIKGTEVFSSDEHTGEIALKALMTGAITRIVVNIALDEATEADLIAAKNVVPAKTHEIDTLIKFVRAAKDPEAQAAERPIRVEITNATELQKDTVLQIHRDESGKLESVTAHKI